MKLAIGITVCRDLEGNVRVVFIIDLSFVAVGYHTGGSVGTGRICDKRNGGENNHIRYAQKELLYNAKNKNSPVPLRHQVSIDGKL